MLYYFMRYKVGYMGLIGSIWESRSVPGDLALMLLYVMIPYLLGSINTAIIVSHAIYHDDIRKYGSGNAGFTNIMRVYGKHAAIITFVGDLFKTILAVMVGWCCLGYITAYIAGFFCFIGHIFPVFYQFRGGKGIMCLTAMLLMLDWRIFLLLLGIFLLMVGMTKYISFGSVLCSMLYPLLFNRLNQGRPFTGMWICQMISIFIALIVVVKHLGNLKRIFSGTESKFEFRKSKKPEEDSEAPAPEPEKEEKPVRINYGALPGGNGKNNKNGNKNKKKK